MTISTQQELRVSVCLKICQTSQDEFRPTQYVTGGTAGNRQTKTTTVQQNVMPVYDTQLYPNPLSFACSVQSTPK
jgi:hypothetical protein